MRKSVMLICVLTFAAMVAGCAVPTEIPNDATTVQAETGSRNMALGYVTGHQFYNSIVVETPVTVNRSKVLDAATDAGDMIYHVGVWLDFKEGKYNETTGVYRTVPHLVYVMIEYHSEEHSMLTGIKEAAMDGEYDLLRFRPLLGGTGYK